MSDQKPIDGLGAVQHVSGAFTAEFLRAQDGKEVPLRLENGGPIIGKSVMKFDEEAQALMAEYYIDDPEIAEFLKGSQPKPEIGFEETE